MTKEIDHYSIVARVLIEKEGKEFFIFENLKKSTHIAVVLGDWAKPEPGLPFLDHGLNERIVHGSGDTRYGLEPRDPMSSDFPIPKVS